MSATLLDNLAPENVVNDTDTWLLHVRSNSEQSYLRWCWLSTRLRQQPLGATHIYGEIKHRASIWLALVRSGPCGWWRELQPTFILPVEHWAAAMGEADANNPEPLHRWLHEQFAAANPGTWALTIFWELALLALREQTASADIHRILWPFFLKTLQYTEHTPESLPLHILPEITHGCSIPVPQELWEWMHRPAFLQHAAYEKHIKPGVWPVLWHAWLPRHWRAALAYRLVEMIEQAIASGKTVRIPDELRAIWQAGPSFDHPYNVLLAQVMLTNARSNCENPWSHQITEHWLDEVEHFYPEAHKLRALYNNLEDISVDDARAWLAQQAFTGDSATTLPTDLLRSEI